MNKRVPILGLVAACGACCAVPLLIPLLTGITVSGAALIGWQAGFALLAGLMALAASHWLLSIRRQRVAASSEIPACECKPRCS